MKKAVNIDYAPVTLDKSDKKVGLSFFIDDMGKKVVC